MIAKVGVKYSLIIVTAKLPFSLQLVKVIPNSTPARAIIETDKTCLKVVTIIMLTVVKVGVT